jgi:hypothetical protein
MEQTPEIIEVNTLALSVPEQAKMITAITNNNDYVKAGNILLTIKDIRKKIEATFKPIKQKFDAAKKEVLDQEKAADRPLIEAENWIKPLISGYLVEQEKIRQAEERRLQELARKEEEERRLLEAIEAEKNGQQDEAQAIIDAPVQAPPVVVPKAVPKVEGISMRENWRFRIVDEKKIPREFLKVDEVKIGAYVRAMKSAGNIPGVEIYNEATIGAGRRAA